MPSGIWELSEYEKLPQYDLPTPQQPMGMFLCHQQDGRACAGWVGVTDMDHCLALRLAASTGSVEDASAFLDYTTPVDLFLSGGEAAAHGVREINDPSPKAQVSMKKLRRKLNKL